MASSADRTAHQPIYPPKRDPFDIDELRLDCASLCAYVMVDDLLGTEPLRVFSDDPKEPPCVCAQDGQEAIRPMQRYKGKEAIKVVLDALGECGFAEVAVLVCPCANKSKEPQYLQALDELKAVLADQGASVQEASREVMAEAARCSHDLSIFNLSAGILQYGLGLCERTGAQGVMFVPCDMVRLEPYHVAKLASAFKDNPDVDVLSSWITWFNRPPYIFRRIFLESLEASDACKLRDGEAFRGAPSFNVEEVVMGEERLEVAPAPTDVEGAFFSSCTLSALEALRKVEAARQEGGPAEEELRRACKDGITSDDALLDAAFKVSALVDDVLSAMDERQQKDVRDMDKWAQRNRLDFPILNAREHANRLVYLDSAATTQRVGQALESQYHFDAFENANIYRGSYPLSANATAIYNDARKVIEDHIGAQRRQTVFTMNTSTSVALVQSAWGERNVSADDVILVAANEHHSNLLPWIMLAQRKGATVEYIPYLPDGRLDMDAYEQLLRKRPKLVSVAHVSNMFAMVNPIAQMAKMAHDAGARILVDAAQSFAHLPLDVEELGCDFLCFSAHKAYGPLGLGCLWIAPDAFEEMDPIAAGGGTVSHVGRDSYYLRMGAIQYELGTPPISQAVGFSGAVRYMEAIGMDSIQLHEATLARLLVGTLRKMGGIAIWGDHETEDGFAGIVAFTQADVRSSIVGSVLGKLGVCVRAGAHCAMPLHASLGLTGTVRFSFSAHTTIEDVKAALVGLEVCRRIYGYESEAATNGSRGADASRGVDAPHGVNGSNNIVDHYSQVAEDALEFTQACDTCASVDALPDDVRLASEAEALYGKDALEGVPLAALAASRGCGDPVAKAQLAPGQVVLDLGSGGGIDAIIASRLVGADGFVYGLDVTPEMVELARQNAKSAGASNMEILEGTIEDVPLDDESVDVIVSNCVINLVDDKAKAFKEVFRLLRPGGRMVVSDILATRDIPAPAMADLCAIAGCRNGIPSLQSYERMLLDIGFGEVAFEQKTPYSLEVLKEKAQRKHRQSHYSAIEDLGLEADIDNASGSYIIVASKI